MSTPWPCKIVYKKMCGIKMIIKVMYPTYNRTYLHKERRFKASVAGNPITPKLTRYGHD